LRLLFCLFLPIGGCFADITFRILRSASDFVDVLQFIIVGSAFGASYLAVCEVVVIRIILFCLLLVVHLLANMKISLIKSIITIITLLLLSAAASHHLKDPYDEKNI
jgi:hypothetical protein